MSSKINDFKEKISLVDFILSRPGLSYKISDSTKKNAIVMYRELTDEKGNSFKSDSILVSRFSKGEHTYDQYFKTHDNWKDKTFSVVDFVHEIILNNLPGDQIDFRQVFGILNQYINSPQYVSPEDSQYNLKVNRKVNHADISRVRDVIKHPTSETFEYLKSRNITPETYLDPIFVSTYGNYVHEIKDKETDKVIATKNNPIFIYQNEHNRAHTVQRIVELFNPDQTLKSRDKFFLKDIYKSSALYKTAKTSKTNINIVVEAPEKAMAHYQLSKEQLDNNDYSPYYIAAGGSLAAEQIQHLSNIIHENRFDTVLGYDKDKAGDLYTLKTLAGIINIGVEVSSQDINAQPFVGLKFVPDAPNQNMNQKRMYSELQGSILSYFSSFPDQHRQQYDPRQGVLYFPYNQETMNALSTKMSSVIKDTLKVSTYIHSPVTKDWVDDLERKNTLKREVHVHPQIPFNTNKSIQNNLL